MVILKFSGGSGTLTNIYDINRTLMEEVVTFKFFRWKWLIRSKFQEEGVEEELDELEGGGA